MSSWNVTWNPARSNQSTERATLVTLNSGSNPVISHVPVMSWSWPSLCPLSPPRQLWQIGKSGCDLNLTHQSTDVEQHTQVTAMTGKARSLTLHNQVAEAAGTNARPRVGTIGRGRQTEQAAQAHQEAPAGAQVHPDAQRGHEVLAHGRPAHEGKGGRSPRRPAGQASRARGARGTPATARKAGSACLGQRVPRTTST